MTSYWFNVYNDLCLDIEKDLRQNTLEIQLNAFLTSALCPSNDQRTQLLTFINIEPWQKVVPQRALHATCTSKHASYFRICFQALSHARARKQGSLERGGPVRRIRHLGAAGDSGHQSRLDLSPKYPFGDDAETNRFRAGICRVLAKDSDLLLE